MKEMKVIVIHPLSPVSLHSHVCLQNRCKYGRHTHTHKCAHSLYTHTTYLYRHTAFMLCNESNIADREGQWILQLQMITAPPLFIVANYFDYKRAF